MTNEEEDIQVEDVGIPHRHRKGERLPESINNTLKTMEIGKSFFLKTNDDGHTNRKIGAIRARIWRLKDDQPDKMFSVHRDTKGVTKGIRIYRLEDDDSLT
jgi:hypothetical protein|tara:strand:+ start:935 stop:1237 length:303 start_codon:yes stop_codon:yes gene_type:complete